MKLNIEFSVLTFWLLTYLGISLWYWLSCLRIWKCSKLVNTKDTGHNMIPWYALCLARSLYLMTIDIEWAAHNFKGKTEDKDMVVTIFRKNLRFCEKVNALFQFAIHISLLFTYRNTSSRAVKCPMVLWALGNTELIHKLCNYQIIGQVNTYHKHIMIYGCYLSIVLILINIWFKLHSSYYLLQSFHIQNIYLMPIITGI